jgi:rhodanese-related sulfurtransferase
MLSSNYFISPEELWRLVASPAAPQIVDVRRREAYDAATTFLPSAIWRDAPSATGWAAELDRTRPVILACKAGHEFSQMAAAQLHGIGVDARVLEGGYAAWSAASLPLVNKAEFDHFSPTRPSLWVTRRRPKIDRVACPWLIRRFLDAQARILFVDPPEVLAVARETGGIPFDITGIKLSHEGERCSFDTMLTRFGLESEPSLARLALIVRGADTARPDIAAEAAGLHAISLGLSELSGDDDHSLLRHGFMVYDALFAWIRYATDERHNWPAKTA